jgi:hypothetical protein
MKSKILKGHLLTAFLVCISLMGFQQCTPDQQKASSYQEILEFTEGIKVINTHEHQHRPDEFGLDTLNFYHLLNGAYLMADLISAGGVRVDMELIGSLDLEEQWELFGEPLNHTRSTSYYGHFIKGFQKLYGFKDLAFTESNIATLSAQVEKNYYDYSSWFDKAFHQAGFELMFLDQYWNSFNSQVDTEHYALVFHINQLVMQVNTRPASGEPPHSIYKEATEEGFAMDDFDDYLNYCDHLFNTNLARKAVCVKNSLAYSRKLKYEEVAYETARSLYAKPSASLSKEESETLQNYIFHWIIDKSIEYDLPIQIHTGYLAGNSNYLENSNPLDLNNLFANYPEAKFVLFHGGYPWTSEFIAMGKMFPNVYLDLVWLPQISREKAVLSLDEMLDCVPYNKIFWGGDCAFIEESTGSLEFAKSAVAETLAKRIDRGFLTQDVAYDIVKRIFRQNAIEVFQLEAKLGRTF